MKKRELGKIMDYLAYLNTREDGQEALMQIYQMLQDIQKVGMTFLELSPEQAAAVCEITHTDGSWLAKGSMIWNPVSVELLLPHFYERFFFWNLYLLFATRRQDAIKSGNQELLNLEEEYQVHVIARLTRLDNAALAI